MVAAHYLNQGSDWNSIKEKKQKQKSHKNKQNHEAI